MKHLLVPLRMPDDVDLCGFVIVHARKRQAGLSFPLKLEKLRLRSLCFFAGESRLVDPGHYIVDACYKLLEASKPYRLFIALVNYFNEENDNATIYT
jgi:hypothetical protein